MSQTFYRFAKKKSGATGQAQPPMELPPLLPLKGATGRLPPRVARFLSNGFDRSLTGGRVSALRP